jgi:hypothetical protein
MLPFGDFDTTLVICHSSVNFVAGREIIQVVKTVTVTRGQRMWILHRKKVKLCHVFAPRELDSSVRLKREGVNVRRLKAKPAAKARCHPDLVGRKTFSVDEIRKYVDPGAAEEAEKFVRLIYEERRQDRERVLPE